MGIELNLDKRHLDVKYLVALVLFGDAPKWPIQGHFEDTSRTCPGHLRDMSGRGQMFGQVWERTEDKFEKLRKDIGQIDSENFWRCPKMVRTGTF